VTNFHEFLITPWNTALIVADSTTTANLTSIGGPADQRVIDGIVQEIDIKTSAVLFQWDSGALVPYADSYLARPSSASTPWDWFHINAVHLDTDGNLLVDSRNTWTVFKVNLHTGHIMWQLGGKQGSFALRAAPDQVPYRDGKIFAWQHDPEAIGDNEYTFFDDESGGHLLASSRVVTVRLNLDTLVATLVESDDRPEGQVAQLMGNAQTVPGGDRFVGWGTLPYISELSPSGKLLYNARSPSRCQQLPRLPDSLDPTQLIAVRLSDETPAAGRIRLSREAEPPRFRRGGAAADRRSAIRRHSRRRTKPPHRAGPADRALRWSWARRERSTPLLATHPTLGDQRRTFAGP
jgi:hypothetical protein